MRVRTDRGERDVLLGSRTVVDGELTVIDWQQAPLAEVFFREQAGDAYAIDVGGRDVAGTLLDRRLLRIEEGALVGLTAVEAAREVLPGRAIRGGASRAPITVDDLDPLQRAAVELPRRRSLCVRGPAGVGKTVVALHRLAHLTREAARDGRPMKALVLVPSEGLRRLCLRLWDRIGGEGLPEMATVDDWIAARARRAFPGLPSRTSRNASAAVIRLKRHPAVRQVLAELGSGRPRRRDLLQLWGDRPRLERIVAAAGGALGDSSIDGAILHTRAQFTATTEEEYAHVDADRLVTVDRRAIDDGTPMEDAGTLDAEDCPVLLELAAARKLRPKLPRYHAIALDEVQLLAPMELAAIARARAPGGTIIASGDSRQQTDDSAWFAGFAAAMDELGATDHADVELIHNYRSAPAIAELVENVIDARPSEPDPSWVVTSSFPTACHQTSALIEVLGALVDRDPTMTIGVIARDADRARTAAARLARGLDLSLVLDGEFTFEPGVVVTSVAEAQGLELDVVVVPDASRAVYPDATDARRALYVAGSRAIDWLWITSVGPLTPLLCYPLPP